MPTGPLTSTHQNSRRTEGWVQTHYTGLQHGYHILKLTKTGYTFVHWYSVTGLVTEYTETTMFAGNAAFYIKWNITQYNFTIIFNNRGEDEVGNLDFNEEIAYLENVMKT